MERPREADLSTEQARAQAPAWFSRTHVDGRRPPRDQRAPREGPQAPLGVTAGLPRLKRRAEFLRVAAANRKWATPGLVLQAVERTAGAEPRVGFTVSRKVGNAVRRNRARRRLRAAADRLMPACAAAGRDYVIIGRPATLERPFEALVGDLEQALRRLGAYR